MEAVLHTAILFMNAFLPAQSKVCLLVFSGFTIDEPYIPEKVQGNIRMLLAEMEQGTLVHLIDPCRVSYDFTFLEDAMIMTGPYREEKLHHFNNKEGLICIDSDGCAMDTMDIKHYRCFGPCMVTEWGLEEWKDQILDRWNQINLYSLTRGINRFAGLAMALLEINDKYKQIEGIKDFKAWTEQAVNRSIDAIPAEEKKPFPGVLEGFQAACKRADIAVVSSANREAVLEEWNRCVLTAYVDVLCCQDAGTKADCIGKLAGLGYQKDHILMVGAALDLFLADAYDSYGKEMGERFIANLAGGSR